LKGCSITEENRQLVGFSGNEEEYLLIPDVILMDGEECRVESVGMAAFEHCHRLKTVVIFEGICEIGSYAFAHCRNLNSITLPRSLVWIGAEAFFDCPRGLKILYAGTKNEWLGITGILAASFPNDTVVECSDSWSGR